MDADLRYPIGKFHRPDTLSAEEQRAAIDAIAEAFASSSIMSPTAT